MEVKVVCRGRIRSAARLAVAPLLPPDRIRTSSATRASSTPTRSHRSLDRGASCRAFGSKRVRPSDRDRRPTDNSLPSAISPVSIACKTKARWRRAFNGQFITHHPSPTQHSRYRRSFWLLVIDFIVLASCNRNFLDLVLSSSIVSTVFACHHVSRVRRYEGGRRGRSRSEGPKDIGRRSPRVFIVTFDERSAAPEKVELAMYIGIYAQGISASSTVSEEATADLERAKLAGELPTDPTRTARPVEVSVRAHCQRHHELWAQCHPAHTSPPPKPRTSSSLRSRMDAIRRSTF